MDQTNADEKTQHDTSVASKAGRKRHGTKGKNVSSISNAGGKHDDGEGGDWATARAASGLSGTGSSSSGTTSSSSSSKGDEQEEEYVYRFVVYVQDESAAYCVFLYDKVRL